MPNVLRSLGMMTADRDDIADQYAQALEVLDGLKKGKISLDNVQLTPQGWKVVVPSAPPPRPPYSTGDPTQPPAKFHAGMGPDGKAWGPDRQTGPPPEQPDFAPPVDLAPPQTGPRPLDLPAPPPGPMPAELRSPQPGQGQPLFHEDR